MKEELEHQNEDLETEIKDLKAAMEEALAFLVKVTRRTQTGVALGYSPR